MKPKLVRDKIPEIIESNKEIPETYTAEQEEYQEKLKEKLLEETQEFINEPNQEELADILEVIEAIHNTPEFNKEEVKQIRLKKKEERGGFEKRIILTDIKKKSLNTT